MEHPRETRRIRNGFRLSRDSAPADVFKLIARTHLGDDGLASELVAVAKLARQAFDGNEVVGLPGRRRQDLVSAKQHAAGLLKAINRLDPRISIALLDPLPPPGSPVHPTSGDSAGHTSNIPAKSFSHSQMPERVIAFEVFLENLRIVESNLELYADKQVDIVRGAPATPDPLLWMIELLAQVWCKAMPECPISASLKTGSFGAFALDVNRSPPVDGLFLDAAVRTALRRVVSGRRAVTNDKSV